MSTTTAVRYTSSRQADARLSIARVLAAGRVRDERVCREAAEQAARAERDSAREQGQLLGDSVGDGDWCLICSRATDHLGEHTDEQVARWRAGWNQY